MEKHGFNEVLHLNKGRDYKGKADVVILVWNDNQIVPAEQYRKAQYPNKVVDIAVCEDPNDQKKQLKEKAIIYNFSPSGGGGGEGGGK